MKLPMLPARVLVHPQCHPAAEPVTAGSGGARRHEEAEVDSGRSIPLQAEGLWQGPGIAVPIAVPISAPPALSRPRDGGLGPDTGNGSGSAGKALREPAPSPDTAAAVAIPGLTASLGRATETGSRFCCAKLFAVAFPRGCMNPSLLLENTNSPPLFMGFFN